MVLFVIPIAAHIEKKKKKGMEVLQPQLFFCNLSVS